MPDFQRLRNPVETCGHCLHPNEVHDFTDILGVDAIRCVHCPDNTCDLANPREVECPQCFNYVTVMSERVQHKMDCTEWRNGERATLQLP
jgi:hypothetical protein